MASERIIVSGGIIVHFAENRLLFSLMMTIAKIDFRKANRKIVRARKHYISIMKLKNEPITLAR